MKKILSLIILFAGIITINACRKDTVKLPEDLIRTVLPQITKDTSTDVLIQDPATFKGRFNVGVFFKDDVKPKKMDVVVVLNGDKTKVKTLKADITSFPTAVDITAASLATLFGKTAADIQTGDVFEIGADVTLNDGTLITVFRTDGTEPYGGDAQNYNDASLTIQYKKVCPLDINDLVGTFTMEDPDFWEGTYKVTTTLDGNVLTLHNWIEFPSGTLKLTVNEKTQSVTVPKQITIPGAAYGYHNWTSVGNGDINACATAITLKLTNTVDEGSFGAATMTMTKD